MSYLNFLSLFLLVTASSALAVGRFHHARDFNEVDAFLSPLVGSHALTGGSGCADLQIIRRQTSPNEFTYDVTGGVGTEFLINPYRIPTAVMGPAYFHQKWTERSGVFGLASSNTTETEVVKDAAGKLKYVLVKRNGYEVVDCGQP